MTDKLTKARKALQNVIAVYDQGTTGYLVKAAFDKARAALAELDAPAEAQPVAWTWLALKDGETVRQYGEHCPEFFRKSAQPLYTTPAAQPLTDEQIDAAVKAEREACARLLDKEADRQEAAWNEHIASGRGGPATSFHAIPRGYAAAIRARKP